MIIPKSKWYSALPKRVLMKTGHQHLPKKRNHHTRLLWKKVVYDDRTSTYCRISDRADLWPQSHCAITHCRA